MKYRVLSKTDKEMYGADIVAILDYLDVAALSSTAGTLSVCPATTAGLMPAVGTTGTDTLPAGMKVSLVALVVDTAFVSGTASSLTIKVGDGGDDDRYLTVAQLQSGQTPVTYLVGTIATNGYAYATADTVDAIFTSVAANLSTFTAGALRLFFRVDDLNQLPKA